MVRGTELVNITPGMVGQYFNEHTGSPTTKQHLSTIRKLFNKLVIRHAIILNPVLSVRTERQTVIEGKTPDFGIEQARQLLRSIDVSNVVGLRDRAVIDVHIYTAVRVGAVSKLNLKHFEHYGSQWSLRFDEKGAKTSRRTARSFGVP